MCIRLQRGLLLYGVVMCRLCFGGEGGWGEGRLFRVKGLGWKASGWVSREMGRQLWGVGRLVD